MTAPGDIAGRTRAASAAPDPAEKERRLEALHRAKAEAELAAADAAAPGSDTVSWRGALLADVVLVKGLAGPAEAAGGAALSGADGEAALAAVEALGYDREAVFFTLSRPEPGIDAEARAKRLRLQIEAVDPAVAIALDAEAAEDLAAAFEVGKLRLGSARRAAGRTLVAADGLEASLSDGRRKQAVWRQLKAAKAEPPVY